MSDLKMYAERDAEALGKSYTDHIIAMTREGLHSKSDIAAELAYRDTENAKLRALLARSRDCFYRLRHDATTEDHINANNLIKDIDEALKDGE